MKTADHVKELSTQPAWVRYVARSVDLDIVVMLAIFWHTPYLGMLLKVIAVWVFGTSLPFECAVLWHWRRDYKRRLTSMDEPIREQ